MPGALQFMRGDIWDNDRAAKKIVSKQIVTDAIGGDWLRQTYAVAFFVTSSESLFRNTTVRDNAVMIAPELC